MSEELLRVNSKVDEDIAKSEFSSKQVSPKVEEPSKHTIATLLNFSRSKQTKFEMKAENIPNIRTILFIFFIHFSVVCILTLISFLTSDVKVLMFNTAIASLLIPTVTIIFFYNFNKSKNTSLLEVIMGVVVGIWIYVALNFGKVYFQKLFYFVWLNEILSVLIRDVALFLAANLFVKITKKASLYDAMLLTVCLYAGYTFASSLDVLIDSLFLNVELTNGQTVVSTGAIVLGEDSFKYVISSFLTTLCFEVLYSATVVSSYAVVNGGVIGLNVSPLKDKRYKEWSLYLLFAITIILHLGATFPSTIKVFNLTLKIVSLVFSAILALTVLNYCLSRMHVINKGKEN